MIQGDDAACACLRQILESPDLESVDDPQQKAQEKREEIRGQAAEEVDRSHNVGYAQDDQRHRLAQPRDLEEQHRHERSADHENGVERIDGADDAGPPILGRPCLHRGEDRHYEKSSRGRIEEDFECDP